MSELEKNKQKKEDEVTNALADFVIRVSKGDANLIETAALPGVAYVLLNQIKKKPETSTSPLETMKNAFMEISNEEVNKNVTLGSRRKRQGHC